MQSAVGRDRPPSPSLRRTGRIPPFHRGRRGTASFAKASEATATPPYKVAPDIPWNCVRQAPRLHESRSGRDRLACRGRAEQRDDRLSLLRRKRGPFEVKQLQRKTTVPIALR